MTINPYTGQILWTPPTSAAGVTVAVSVQVQNLALPSKLESQLNQFQIEVNALSPTAVQIPGVVGTPASPNPTSSPSSPAAAYINDVFGALLERLPTAQELSQWTTALRTGTSLLSFVATISLTVERYQILTGDVYLTVLDREPTAQEMTNAVEMFESGGSSDGLTRQLLTSAEFIADHPGNRAYVDAVNQLLTARDGPAGLTASEVAWLGAGGSRTRLVGAIYYDDTATMHRAKQLALQYLGRPTSRTVQSQWAKALARGTLNSDSLTNRILASQTYANGSSSRAVPDVFAGSSAVHAQHNRRAHPVPRMDFLNTRRSERDDLESERQRPAKLLPIRAASK
jgi:hypothetical protein